MPPPRRHFRVSRDDLNHGASIEAKEHPSFGERSTRRIARDHIEQYGPGYYRTEGMHEKMIEQVNARMHAKPMRKKRPEPAGPFFDPSMRQLRF
jgi:hypothetical protein